MGMYDTVVVGDDDYQTKAWDCQLAWYRQGDVVPALELSPKLVDYQVEGLRGRDAERDFLDVFIQIREGRVADVTEQPVTGFVVVGYGGTPLNGELDLAELAP